MNDFDLNHIRRIVREELFFAHVIPRCGACGEFWPPGTEHASACKGQKPPVPPIPAAPQVADGPISDIIMRFDAIMDRVRSNGRVPQSAAISCGVDSLTYGDLIGLRNWAARTQNAEHDAGSLRVQMSHVCKELDSAREAERVLRDKLERALEEETNTRVAHGVAVGQMERLTRELDKLRKDVASEIEGAVESRSMSDNEGRRMLALVEAPTPAAPCARSADVEELVTDIMERVDPEGGKSDQLLLRAASMILALAETKAEGPVEAANVPAHAEFQITFDDGVVVYADNFDEAETIVGLARNPGGTITDIPNRGHTRAALAETKAVES